MDHSFLAFILLGLLGHSHMRKKTICHRRRVNWMIIKGEYEGLSSLKMKFQAVIDRIVN